MININLVAERRARKLREMSIIRMTTTGVVIAMLLMIGLNIWAWSHQRILRQNIVIAQEALDSLEIQRQALQVILDDINAKRPVVELLGQVRVSEAAWMTILADLSDVTGNDVVLTSFVTTPLADGITLRIAGKAQDEETVGAFMIALREGTAWAQTPVLGGVNAEDDALTGAARVRFDLTVPVKDLLGGDL